MQATFELRRGRINHHRRPRPTASPETNIPEEIEDAISLSRECVQAGAYQEAIPLIHVILDRLAHSVDPEGKSLATRQAAECSYLLGTACQKECYFERALHAFLLCASIREHLFGREHGSAVDARLCALSIMRPLFPKAFDKLRSPEDVPTLVELELLTTILEDRYLAGVKEDNPSWVADAIFAGLDVHFHFRPHHKSGSVSDGIVDNYAEITHRTDLAESPLLLAVRFGAEKVCSLLLDKNGIALPPNYFELHGLSPLIVAASFGRAIILRDLLEAGADANAASPRDGTTPLHAACSQKEFNCVLMLIGHGAEVNVFNAAGETPLMISSMKDHLVIARILLEHGADVNAAKKDGVTALFFACQHGYEDLVSLLLHRGADPNAMRTVPDELSVLQIAAAHGFSPICDLLVHHGARAYHRSREGVTAADLARNYGHMELSVALEILEKVQ